MTAPVPWYDRDNKLIQLFWYMATERRTMEIKRRMGAPPPWTHDRVLAVHRFTNVYRASDRVSQYLIRHVQYNGNQDPEEVVFRTLIFKLFNQIGTWEYLCKRLEGPPSLDNWNPFLYSSFLNEYRALGGQIWNNAYMITPPLATYGGIKHEGWLHIFDKMVQDTLPWRVYTADSLDQIYHLLLKYPTVGKFFAFQWTIDINYSSAVDFDENSFVVAGPGAVRGVRKVFGTALKPELAIQTFVAEQELFLNRFDLHFPFLGGIGYPYVHGRRLHLVDVQSLFCEFDKYTRVAVPELDHAQAGYKRIKQSYTPSRNAQLLEPAFYPPKWGLVEGATI